MSQREHPAGAIAAWALSHGIRNIGETPGLFVRAVDEHWTVKINPHDEAIDGIPPGRFAVFWNEWPAACFGPISEEIVFVAGEAANIDTFLEALRAGAGRG